MSLGAPKGSGSALPTATRIPYAPHSVPNSPVLRKVSSRHGRQRDVSRWERGGVLHLRREGHQRTREDGSCGRWAGWGVGRLGLPEREGERRERERVLRVDFPGSHALRAQTSAPPPGAGTEGRTTLPGLPGAGSPTRSSDSRVHPGFPRAPRPTSQFPVPTAPRAARCDLEAADLGRSPCRLSSPQASVPDPSGGVGRGTSPPPPAESSGGTGAGFFPLHQLGGGARAALAPRTEGPASRVPAEPPAETVTRAEPLPGKARETICRQRSWQAAPSWLLRKAE